jgi:hypothetical protein
MKTHVRVSIISKNFPGVIPPDPRCRGGEGREERGEEGREEKGGKGMELGGSASPVPGCRND